MKSLLRAGIILILYLILSACGETSQVTPAPGATSLPTITSSLAATATFEHTPTPEYVLPTINPTLAHEVHTPVPEYVPPTLIPTIDPTRVPDLLHNAFSVQMLPGINGYKLQQIAGWEYGFGAGIWQYSCSGYYWLDTNHLLLYPSTGQEMGGPEGAWQVNVAPQPVIINLTTGEVWLPAEEASAPSWSCYPVHGSKELGILIISGTYNDKSAVFTYTLDGKRLAAYPGELSSVSPSKTKILIRDNLLIDLRTGKEITLAWSLEDYHEFILSELFWTSDEKRVYRCCYFYADLTTETSYRFERSDFQFTDGTHLDPDGLWFYRGQWIRNDTYFLIEWSWIDDGDIRYLPMLDPAKKRFYDVREMAGISEDWSCMETVVSPDGKYVWMTGWGEEGEGNYLIDLFTFETQYYPGKMYLHIDWSPNSKFAWLYNGSRADKTDEYFILSVAAKKISPLPSKPLYDGNYLWHTTNNILVYPSEDQNNLIFLDAATLSFQQLPFTTQGPEYSSDKLAWSPDGEKIVFVAGDGSLWQVRYPKLENAEQLTPSLPDVHGIHWSPGGNSIAFISGSDIYIVDTIK